MRRIPPPGFFFFFYRKSRFASLPVPILHAINRCAWASRKLLLHNRRDKSSIKVIDFIPDRKYIYANITLNWKRLMENEERIIALETKIAYLEKYADDLNQALLDQERLIKKISSELDRVKKQIEDSKEQLPAQEKPPHY